VAQAPRRITKLTGEGRAIGQAGAVPHQRLVVFSIDSRGRRLAAGATDGRQILARAETTSGARQHQDEGLRFVQQPTRRFDATSPEICMLKAIELGGPMSGRRPTPPRC